MVPPNTDPPSFGQICQQIAFQLAASEWQQKIADPQYRAYLAGLYRLALIDEDED